MENGNTTSRLEVGRTTETIGGGARKAAPHGLGRTRLAREHGALRKDLEGAKDVQQAFLPPRSLSIPCISCETFYQPAHSIGGDYYDLLSLPEGRWGIAIGDVSGKGIGAALLMASLQASLRAQALHPHLDLSTLIGDVNRLVHESSPTNFFASLFYAEYEPATRLLKYANAGHNAPIVVRPGNDSCEMYHLEPGGMPVGISADSQFATTTFQFEIDDVLVAYTDGITEVENPHGELWGEQRLENLLRPCSRETPEQIIKCILHEVSAFANGQPQRDDATLVVMSVQEGCEKKPASSEFAPRSEPTSGRKMEAIGGMGLRDAWKNIR